MDFRRIRAEHQQSALGEERLQRIMPLGRSVNYLTQYTTDSSHWILRPKRLQHNEGAASDGSVTRLHQSFSASVRSIEVVFVTDRFQDFFTWSESPNHTLLPGFCKGGWIFEGNVDFQMR
jgi:hypothetical protein